MGADAHGTGSRRVCGRAVARSGSLWGAPWWQAGAEGTTGPGRAWDAAGQACQGPAERTRTPCETSRRRRSCSSAHRCWASPFQIQSIDAIACCSPLSCATAPSGGVSPLRNSLQPPQLGGNRHHVRARGELTAIAARARSAGASLLRGATQDGGTRRPFRLDPEPRCQWGCQSAQAVLLAQADGGSEAGALTRTHRQPERAAGARAGARARRWPQRSP